MFVRKLNAIVPFLLQLLNLLDQLLTIKLRQRASSANALC